MESALAGKYGEGTRTTAVIIDKGGAIHDWAFAEHYTPFTPQRTFSVAKSLAATLVGMAVYRGEPHRASTN